MNSVKLMCMSRFSNICIWLLIASCGSSAQTEEMYTRLSMPAVSRALSLYRGQLQIGTGLTHKSGNSYFDRYGTRLSFEESARDYLANNLHFSLGYGIIDFIEISSSISIHNEIEAFPIYTVLNGQAYGDDNTRYHTTGLNNLDLRIKVRQPLFESGFDLSIAGGISIPVSIQNPRQPGHAIYLEDPQDPGGVYELDYVYRPRPGSNSTYYYAGGDAKYGLERLGITLGGFWTAPLRAESSIRWKHRLYGDQFVYRIEAYDKLPQNSLGFHGVVTLQVFPWFACFAGWRHDLQFGGWSEITGTRISLPPSSLGAVTAGFEIQVTTNLRISQFFDIPIYGKEHYSEFSVRTGIGYSVVPLKNLYH